VVAITTSMPATSVADDPDLKAALRNAIAFSATFVTVLKAWLVEDRIYILVPAQEFVDSALQEKDIPHRGRLGDRKPEHVQLTQDEGVQNPRTRRSRCVVG